MLAIGFVFLSASSIITIIKCAKYGNENAFKSQSKDKTEAKGFEILNTLIAIFTLLFILLFVVGVIVMLI